jgi:type I restriction enzyme M protein
MHWIAPTSKDAAATDLEQRLSDAADELRANSGLKSSEYSQPVLGLIFLRFADVRFAARRSELEKSASGRRGSRVDDPAAYHASGVIFLPSGARFGELLAYPEGGKNGKSLGQAVDDAMRAIERENPQLAGVLPKTYQVFNPVLLKELLKLFSTIPAVDGDAFGRIYEYFLGWFAAAEGQGGGEFYTPTSIVRLLVEILEPFHGRILDPACGSGGMFVQSARFVEEHKKNGGPSALSIHGVEKVDATGQLARMNLAVHGLEGDIRHGGDINSYYDDPHNLVGRFDFVLANPPFNVDSVDRDRIRDALGEGRRFPFGLPPVDNANYLWIQLFYAALNSRGRAGFVMASGAEDARSELPIRRSLIETEAVDVMISVGEKMFYTAGLPCRLWFLDRGKPKQRRDRVLFIDARGIYRSVDRSHRDWSEAQIGFLANIVRLYRGEDADTTFGGEDALRALREHFGKRPRYRDIQGFCKAATISDIAEAGWSLNPGPYVGVAPGEEVASLDFLSRLAQLSDDFDRLTVEARELETSVIASTKEILRS